MSRLIALLLAALLSCGGRAEMPVETRVLYTRVAGLAFITAYGIAKFDYGQSSPQIAHERWFQADTTEGGADKLGHLYTTYALSHAFGGLYEHWGLEPRQAALQGSVSAFVIMGYMEVGDSFSPYGFSAEDMLMNVLGGLLGYQLYVNEAWRQRVDLRWEYRPRLGTEDIFTDYEHSRYLVALKLGGFTALQDTPLAWFELQAGYYARGYSDVQEPDRRTAFVGLGLDISRLFRKAGFRKAATLFNYWQPPDSSLRVEHKLDE